MQYRPLHHAIAALMVAFALATTPALSWAPDDSPWHIHPMLANASGARS